MDACHLGRCGDVTRPVTVQFFKNPDIIHWGFEGVRLGEDEWGDWVALPAGSRRWKGPDEKGRTSSHAVLCAPRGEWWHLHYDGNSAREWSHFVDIVTPPVWVSPNRYEMIDLDLDVAVTVDGEVVVEDEDEFAIHQVKYGYTDEMIAAACETTRNTADRLKRREEPFFEVATGWLAQVAAD